MSAIARRSDPCPWSFVFWTVMVLALAAAGSAPASSTTVRIARRVLLMPRSYPPRGERSIDRDVLDLGLELRLVEPVEVPVDQRPEREQQLALERVELLLELVRDGPPQGLHDRDQRREVRDRACAAAAGGAPVRIGRVADELVPAGRAAGRLLL